jgi:Flp pilus assembly pilin Flp
MKALVTRFIREEQGQDLIEYTLLLAFVCLAAAGLFIAVGQSTSTIWSATSVLASNAASVAKSATAS